MPGHYPAVHSIPAREQLNVVVDCYDRRTDRRTERERLEVCVTYFLVDAQAISTG